MAKSAPPVLCRQHPPYRLHCLLPAIVNVVEENKLLLSFRHGCRQTFVAGRDKRSRGQKRWKHGYHGKHPNIFFMRQGWSCSKRAHCCSITTHSQWSNDKPERQRGLVQSGRGNEGVHGHGARDRSWWHGGRRTVPRIYNTCKVEKTTHQ